MQETPNSYGGRLYAELRRLGGYEFITDALDFAAIQRLKHADRDETVALYCQGSKELLDCLRTSPPEKAARFIIAEARKKAQEMRNREMALLGIIEIVSAS
jgi:hypothetical protein